MQEKGQKMQNLSVSDEKGVNLFIFSNFILICLQKGRYLQRFLW